MKGNLFRDYVYPIATFSGSVIGVGFLSLPYITLQVGIIAMLFYFIVLTALMVFLHLIFGEISLKTPDFKRFPGFVKYYLGKKAELVTFFLTIFGLFGVLLAYLIVGSQFLTAIFQPVFGGSFFVYVVCYFVFLSFVTFFGVNAIAKIEFWALSLLLVLLLFVGINGFPKVDISNIFLKNPMAGISSFFLPYGAIIFSLWGTGLIPEVEEMLAGRKRLFKKVIVIATLIPAVLYLLFIFLILGISGQNTTESALIGLRDYLGDSMIPAALFVGVVTTFTAFVANGLLLKKMFIYDMGMKKFHAWALTCFVPLLLFFLGFNSFIPLISFVGGVFLGINGVFILLMYQKIGGRKIVIYPLTVFFILGIIYEIVYFIT